MADDDRRVEPRHVMVGRGFGTTPERIAEIDRQARQMERMRRKPLGRSFADVLQEGASEEEDEPELSDKEKRRRALPRNGPRPALAHPMQRRLYGRDRASDEDVVIKG